MRKPMSVLYRRRPRCFIALLAVVCLLGQQFALAAYACPLLAGTPATLDADCQQSMPTTQSPLCAQHCAPDSSATPDTRTPGVPALALPPSPPILVGVFLPARSSVVPVAATRIHEPPPRLRYCSLQI